MFLGVGVFFPWGFLALVLVAGDDCFELPVRNVFRWPSTKRDGDGAAAQEWPLVTATSERDLFYMLRADYISFLSRRRLDADRGSSSGEAAGDGAVVSFLRNLIGHEGVILREVCLTISAFGGYGVGF